MKTLLLDPQVTTIALWVAGGLFMIIWFFLVFYFKRSIETNDKLNDSVVELKVTVSALNTAFKAQEAKNEDVDEELKCHDNKLNDHERRIVILEANR